MAGPGSRASASPQPLLYVIALAGGVALAIIVGLLLNKGGAPDLASATCTPGADGSGVAIASVGPSPELSPGDSSVASLEPAASAPPTGAPSATQPPRTPAPTSRSTPRPTLTPTPTATKPKIDTFTANPTFITTCDGFTSVTLTWTTTNADAVSIAIDPQGESPLKHIYLDNMPLDGSTQVPYSCDPPNTDPNTGDKYHEYYVIATKGTTHVWRFIKVYIHPVT
jgi:hypothetical protein